MSTGNWQASAWADVDPKKDGAIITIQTQTFARSIFNLLYREARPRRTKRARHRMRSRRLRGDLPIRWPVEARRLVGAVAADLAEVPA